jgi:predicted ArsR family transcriptional regulator
VNQTSSNELPPELRAFLYSCIDTVEQVEILALLCREEGPWTARATAARIGIPDAAARNHLETLAARGLLQIAVAAEVRYAYAPKNAELRRYADQLSQQYANDRTAIMRFVASNPRRLRRFSDAFKLRDPE